MKSKEKARGDEKKMFKYILYGKSTKNIKDTGEYKKNKRCIMF